MKKILIVIVLMALSGVMGWIAASHSGKTAVREDTTRVVVVDTIPCYLPVAKDSVVVRYVTVVAAAEPQPTGKEWARDTGMTGADMTDTDVQADSCDSVRVIIPIMQKTYETERYRAYVSGYEARLDSIFVKEWTVTERIAPTGKPPSATRKPRMGFGLSTGVGYGLIHKGMDLYVGLGFNVTW